MNSKKPAPQNRSLRLSQDEARLYAPQCLTLNAPANLRQVTDKTICQDLFQVLPFLPEKSFDLIFADPPYNLSKNFNGLTFSRTSRQGYAAWLRTWLPGCARLLKPGGSIYVCGDWRSSSAIEEVLSEHFIIQNRITWEREKGRAARANWKNASEDIWFATMGAGYGFNSQEVKVMRKVLAPYRDSARQPKDWQAAAQGGRTRFRLTGSSNLWTDITVPFWSMAENTEHPTQKPEKLLAKIILASSQAGGLVFDPFAGVGTTQVVAKKLGRHYLGVELNPLYCALAVKRLAMADEDKRIQGYYDGIFWERNSKPGL